jgi:hypothetical protein
MTDKDTGEIKIDLAALRQAKAERALQRESVEIVDFAGKLARLKEFNILSNFARRKEREN